MPSSTLPALLRRLEERPSSQSIFLYGEEEYLRERAVQAVVGSILDPATRDFNLDQVRGSEVTAEALGSALATPPMMAEHRVVVVREAQGLSVKAREVVERVAARPYPGLVLVISAAIPGGSKAKFYDALRKSALSIAFPQVDPEDLPAWIIEYGRAEAGVEIDLDAARAWAAAIGSQLGVLVVEIEKAVAYVGDADRITLGDVKAIGGYIPRVDRWRWFEKVGERRFVDALAEVPELLDSGESGVGLVLGLGGHLLKLGLLVEGGREGFERNVDSRQKWLAQKLLPQARQWSTRQIDRALGELLRTDRLLKSASLTDRQAMEELLLRLAADGSRPGDGAARAGLQATPV